ncbi:hypothetical protein ACFX13_014728 [Malus domestica]|uniref:UPF0481 protein At3g47200-like n=1 Tax=Malus domestica TaxID=3750 RepID=UPI000498E05E|nr:UPF0481 protein At3g47200-like [Malus domestica]XP_050122092.1 UPF0481 protein At3g47200-like [Malus sylvestris]
MEEVRISSKEERFEKLRKAPEAPDYSSNPKIQKVPFMLRKPKTSEKYYEPRAVAIGPFHHGNPRCELAEEFKLMLTKRFLKYTSQTVEALHQKVEKKIKELRECYAEEATQTYDDETLAWMLFLDGCSTLQFIHSFVDEELEELSIKRDQIAFAQQDLFLLENQVPYQVLELLMSSSNKCEDLKKAIETYVQANIGAPGKKQSEKKVAITMEKEKEPAHQEKEPAHLLDLLRTRMLGPPKNPDKRAKDHSVQSFRNVQELDAAGIHFKLSNSSLLGDISFVSHSFAGYLSLPAISVDDSTGPKFMNLIAYEMCPDFQNDFAVTSYISFLDALIDHADDVKELRSAGVLYNLLGSDKEVAKLFNEIGTDLVPNTDIYHDVKAEIEKHYKTKWKTWMSQFCHDHFRSPWTFLAFVGVLAALGLTGIQTWFAVYSPSSPCDVVART